MEAAWIVHRVPGGFSNVKDLISPSCQECPGKGVQGKSLLPELLPVQHWKILFNGDQTIF